MNNSQKRLIGQLFATWNQTLDRRSWTATTMEPRQQFIEGQLFEMTRNQKFPDAEKVIAGIRRND